MNQEREQEEFVRSSSGHSSSTEQDTQIQTTAGGINSESVPRNDRMSPQDLRPKEDNVVGRVCDQKPRGRGRPGCQNTLPGVHSPITPKTDQTSFPVTDHRYSSSDTEGPAMSQTHCNPVEEKDFSVRSASLSPASSNVCDLHPPKKASGRGITSPSITFVPPVGKTRNKDLEQTPVVKKSGVGPQPSVPSSQAAKLASAGSLGKKLTTPVSGVTRNSNRNTSSSNTDSDVKKSATAKQTPRSSILFQGSSATSDRNLTGTSKKSEKKTGGEKDLFGRLSDTENKKPRGLFVRLRDTETDTDCKMSKTPSHSNTASPNPSPIGLSSMKTKSQPPKSKGKGRGFLSGAQNAALPPGQEMHVSSEELKIPPGSKSPLTKVPEPKSTTSHTRKAVADEAVSPKRPEHTSDSSPGVFTGDKNTQDNIKVI